MIPEKQKARWLVWTQPLTSDLHTTFLGMNQVRTLIRGFGRNTFRFFQRLHCPNKNSGHLLNICYTGKKKNQSIHPLSIHVKGCSEAGENPSWLVRSRVTPGEGCQCIKGLTLRWTVIYSCGPFRAASQPNLHLNFLDWTWRKPTPSQREHENSMKEGEQD